MGDIALRDVALRPAAVYTCRAHEADDGMDWYRMLMSMPQMSLSIESPAGHGADGPSANTTSDDLHLTALSGVYTGFCRC